MKSFDVGVDTEPQRSHGRGIQVHTSLMGSLYLHDLQPVQSGSVMNPKDRFHLRRKQAIDAGDICGLYKATSRYWFDLVCRREHLFQLLYSAAYTLECNEGLDGENFGEDQSRDETGKRQAEGTESQDLDNENAEGQSVQNMEKDRNIGNEGTEDK